MENETYIVKSHDVRLDGNYADWLRDIKSRYRRSRIKAGEYQKQGHALNNFPDILPLPHAQLAEELTKENYDLGFVTLPPQYNEKQLEDALYTQITQFLLELGTSFAFIDRQKEMVIAGKTRRIDLLFYHIRLRS